GLYIIRIQEIDGSSYLHTVHYIEWVGRTIHGCHTADTDGETSFRVTGRTDDRYTCRSSLQTLSQVHRIPLHHFLRIHGSHRTGEVGFLHRTVAHNNYLI